MRQEFTERIQQDYQKMIERGVDPHVAKKRILRRRIKLSTMISFNALRRLLLKKKR